VLYAVDQEEPEDFLALTVGPSGAVLSQVSSEVVTPYSSGIHYDPGNGLVYADGGQAILPSNGSPVGSYGASGIAAPDSTLDRVFILGQTEMQAGTSSYTIESFDQAKFTAIDSIIIDNVLGTPTALIRWGSNGLAFTTRVGGLCGYRTRSAVRCQRRFCGALRPLLPGFESDAAATSAEDLGSGEQFQPSFPSAVGH
jgi:hypothetical protein